MISFSQAQTFVYSNSLGIFDKAASFYIAANGFIYITDTDEDEIMMMDSSGNVIKTYGGYGWDENSFDDPFDVFADPLTVYIADKNNHRIKKFDKNLNFISSLYTRESDISEERFGYPLSCATSNQGDLFIVDSENERIIKFDIFGKFKLNFGGMDAGNFMLNDPTQLAISSLNNVYVIDGENIVVFDQYGNGISRIQFKQKLNSIRILFDLMIITTDNEIFFNDLRNDDSKPSTIALIGIDEVPKIISAIVFNNKLYVLTKNTILAFNKVIKN